MNNQLHSAIMNLPNDAAKDLHYGTAETRAYNEGHKVAHHAIAELVAAHAWEPQFDVMVSTQEELAIQFTTEINQSKGLCPVRLQEMAQALYDAERRAVGPGAAQSSEDKADAEMWRWLKPRFAGYDFFGAVGPMRRRRRGRVNA